MDFLQKCINLKSRSTVTTFTPSLVFLFFITGFRISFAQDAAEQTSPLMMWGQGGPFQEVVSVDRVEQKQRTEQLNENQRWEELREPDFLISDLMSRSNQMSDLKEGDSSNGNKKEGISFETFQRNKFLNQLKTEIDPEVHDELIRRIEEKRLDSNPFSAGIAWRSAIKNATVSQSQPREQQEDYIQKVLRAVQETYCEVHHLPYRLDTEGRVEVLPKKDRIKDLLKKATDAAQSIKEDSLEGYPPLVRTFLKSIFLATPSAEELVENFKKTNSAQQKIKILNAVKAKNFSIDSNLEALHNNLEKKGELSSSLARLIELEMGKRKLAEKALDENTVPRLRDFEFFSDPSDRNNKHLGLKNKRQAALDRIQKLAPLSDIAAKLQEGTIRIDYAAITQLVQETPLPAKRFFMKDKTQADLKREIFEYLCHDLAFKFNQAYYEVAAISKNQPEMYDENGQPQIKPLVILKEKLRYMTLFLELLSNNYEKIGEIRGNRGDLEVVLYEFLRKVTNSIQDINSALTGEYPNYQLAEENVVLPSDSEIDFFNKMWTSSYPDRSLRELQQGIMNQNNSQVFYNHLRKAQFLILDLYCNNYWDDYTRSH
ncbi:MAG: hypothetical protein FJ390_02160 [Verrucomicrobia bacterium]|nr:hypothetical protein [Verrucomicrobiota bacterium]